MFWKCQVDQVVQVLSKLHKQTRPKTPYARNFELRNSVVRLVFWYGFIDVWETEIAVDHLFLPRDWSIVAIQVLKNNLHPGKPEDSSHKLYHEEASFALDKIRLLRQRVQTYFAQFADSTVLEALDFASQTLLLQKVHSVGK